MATSHQITELKAISSQTIKDLTRLTSQLNPDFKPPLNPKQVAATIKSPHTRMFVIKHQHRLIATLSICFYHKSEGPIAWIEDVVVDKSYRRQGYAKALINHGLSVAKSLGCQAVYLTSRPSRRAANYLYQKLGFVKRPTNCYKLTLK